MIPDAEARWNDAAERLRDIVVHTKFVMSTYVYV